MDQTQIKDALVNLTASVNSPAARVAALKPKAPAAPAFSEDKPHG